MARHLIAALALALVAQVHAAPATLPDSPVGRVLGAWLASFNSGDEAHLRAFDARHRHQARDVEALLEFRAETGGFKLLRVEHSEPHSVTVLMQEQDSDTVARMTLTVTASQPTKVGSTALSAVPRPPDLAVLRLAERAALNALGARADQLAAADRFAGSVMVVRNGMVVMRRHWGLADREVQKPISADTRFRIGSMNKMFTSVAVLRLVEDGKVALDDPIGKHLPNYPNRDAAAKVTLRHLLTHSGGTGDFFGPEFHKQRDALREPADYVALFGPRALAFEPGARFEYSNYGYVLLGAIVEAATGESYFTAMRRLVFVPAGMAATGSAPETEAVPQRAKGYTRDPRDGKSWVSNAGSLPWRGSPAGGGYSTASDLLRFAQALEGGKLLSKLMLVEATRSQREGYGFGFGARGEGALRSYGHNGGAPGMNGDLRIYPELGLVLVALSNVDPPVATRLLDFYALRMPVSR